MDRAKVSSVAPAGFTESKPINPRKEYKEPSARPPGRSGGGVVEESKRSTYRRGYRPRG
jgi:hypothetical protein